MTTDAIRVRRIVTPEGVPLPFEVAGAGDRLAAFAVDFFVIHVAIVIAVGAALLVGWAAAGPYALSFGLLASFLVRNFYFAFSELRWGGSTIGKRRFGLRVVARDGGALTPEAVLARNFTRELEVFLPLAALLQPSALLPGLPGWAVVVGTVWLAVFAVLPLTNRDRLRVGDLAGGTIVVRMPEAALHGDLTHDAAATGAGASDRYRFTEAQLDLYGIHELHVLEDILRKERAGARQEPLVRAVAERIRRKIRWDSEVPDEDALVFLESFYGAQRARLERELLFGVRRERKRE
jgi:uncharacterized RDD family membrane protein YckC